MQLEMVDVCNGLDQRFAARIDAADRVAAELAGNLQSAHKQLHDAHIAFEKSLISKSAVPASMNTLSAACFGCYEYTQKSRTYTPYNVAISTLHYHSITGVLLGLNGGSCNWRAA